MILKLVKLLIVVVVSCSSAELTKQHAPSTISGDPISNLPQEIPSKILEPPEKSDVSRNLNIEEPSRIEKFDTEDYLSSIPARVETPMSENMLEGSGDDLKGDATFWWPRFYSPYPRYYWDYGYRPRYHYGYYSYGHHW